MGVQINNLPAVSGVPVAGDLLPWWQTLLGTTVKVDLLGTNLTWAGTQTFQAAISAEADVVLSPASHNVTLSPTGTGTVTIDPATAGTVDNVMVGGVTPKDGTFTTVDTITSLTTPLIKDPSANGVTISFTGADGGTNFNAPTSVGGAYITLQTEGVDQGYIEPSIPTGTLVIQLAAASRYFEVDGHPGAAQILFRLDTNDASATFFGQVGLAAYTVLTLPSAAVLGQIIAVSNGILNKRLAVSDGTNWRWPDGIIVS